jgi:hypothetical protein
LGAVPFTELPDEARVWVFAATRPLSAEQAQAVIAETDRFLAGWHAHGHPVVGGRELTYDRFLMIGADEAATGVSGCSIDSLFRVLKQLEREVGITLLDSSPVWFRDRDGAIGAVSRPEFRERARTGQVDTDTIVFNNTVGTLGEVRSGRWEAPARDSWHAKLL